MDTLEVIKKVKKLEIKTKHLVDGLLQGAYHSIFKGRGIEFSEVRPYQIGDDVRSIDWNVTARLNEPYVKEFIEERDLTIYLIFDISGSGEFGNIKEKRDAAIELSASLMFAALRNNDKIGLGLFTDHLERFIPAKKGKRHVLKLLREMIVYEPSSRKTNIKATLSYLASILKKRSIIFIVSDFQSDNFIKPLKIMKLRHDVILVNIFDLREFDIPDIGYIELEDEETGEQVLVDTSDSGFRDQYSKLINKKFEEFKSSLKKINVDFILLNTEQSYDIPLKRFFKMRMMRR